MAVVSDLLEVLESIAPARWAFGFDRVGLQIGSRKAPVTHVVVSLDRSLAAVEFAKKVKADVLLAHHPLLFHPIDRVDASDHVGKTVTTLIRAGISFVAAHTNWDCAPGGINDALCERLGLIDVCPFGAGEPVAKVKMVVTVPTAQAESIIDAASSAGAGVIGAYTRCAFRSTGTGVFDAGLDTHPTVGEAGSREEIDETRIEMTCLASSRSVVEAAIRKAHPYEEAVIDFYALTSTPEFTAGRIASLPQPQTLKAFAQMVDKSLGTKSLTWGSPDQVIRKVAVVGGAGDPDCLKAKAAGADLFITGEVRQHIAVEAVESGLAVMSAGHYATEQPGVEALAKVLGLHLQGVTFTVFEPAMGLAGRPF